MSSAIGSVVIASAQSVAKVFVIGGVGYLAVLYPREAPFLPRHSVGNVARFSFHALTIPLIYSTIAIAVTLESVGNYWFVFVGAFLVLIVSYLVATSLRHLGLLRDCHLQDINALRVAATFPNIVALPILIFPSLCEFPVVYEGYIPRNDNPGNDDAINGNDSAYLQRQCVAQSTTMIFCYFFSWSLAFWSFGNRQLLQAAHQRHKEETFKSGETMQDAAETANENLRRNSRNIAEEGEDARGWQNEGDQIAASESNAIENGYATARYYESNIENESSSTIKMETNNDTILEKEAQQANHDDDNPGENNPIKDSTSQQQKEPPSCLEKIWIAVKQTTTSPGFIAMVAAFVTACISPLQKALFEGGGPLRFLGSAMETLGTASSPLSTMIVAASLVSPRQADDHHDNSEEATEEESFDATRTHHPSDGHDGEQPQQEEPSSRVVMDENPAMSDPNFGPYQRRQKRRHSRFQKIRRSLRSGSIRMLQAVPRSRPKMLRLHLWFCLSRLIVTPAVIVGLIMALDCSGDALKGVPNLAKLVIIVNSALPGALIVIVLLKSNDSMSETASAVAKVYLPSYILSIFTIAAWTAVGLWITLPNEDGLSFCKL